MATLTKRQKQIYDFTKSYINRKGFSPTLEEIKKHFRLSSLSTIHQHIETLADKGVLTKDDNLARGIQLAEDGSKLIEIPLAGIIAAGVPIEAIEAPEAITVAQSDIGRFGDYYALRVQGSSMIDDGIYDGDIVVIRKQPVAENGQTVVAILNENEATLKKIYREKDRFRLQPANPTLFPIYTKEVEVRGIVVKIIRNFEKKAENVQEQELQRRIDYSWDFNGAKTKPYTHGLHTYPAMFIPQVARRLLLTYSKKGDTICDIFCGSGTALVESRVLGRHAYGIDLNPLAIFLARVKTTPVNPIALNKSYLTLLDRIKKLDKKDIERPEFNNLDFWFKERTIIELAKLKKAIKEIKSQKERDFFMVAFSETARKASNTKGNEFKLVRRKKEELDNYNPNVLEIFQKRINAGIKGMEEFYKDFDKKSWARPIYGDATESNGIRENSIDCIITSPPYGDSRTTVAYGQFSRLSAQWTDIFDDPNEASGVDNNLLGGKAAENLVHSLASSHLVATLSEIEKKDVRRARDVLSFYIGLNDCLKNAYNILKQHKYFCLVIGNRLVKQVRIPTDFIIAELGENIGFTCEDILVRNIPGKRMPIKNSPTNKVGALEDTMTKESIVILRKS